MTSAPDYLVIGHLTADLTPEGRFLGGTVSYAARTAHAFGLRVGVLTSAAAGEPLLAELAPYAEVRTLPASATSTFENIYHANGRTQYIRGVAEKLTAADIPDDWRSAPLVHLAPLTDEVDPQIAHLFPDAMVLLTLQGWLRRWDADGRVRFKRWFDREVLRSIDIVVYSEDDILEAPAMEADFIAATEHLVVTRAERGGSYFNGGDTHPYDTLQVEVVNPTGAGDVFAGALLSSLHLLGGDMQSAIKVAARMGAISVTRWALEGTPTPEEAQAALAAVTLAG